MTGDAGHGAGRQMGLQSLAMGKCEDVCWGWRIRVLAVKTSQTDRHQRARRVGSVLGRHSAPGRTLPANPHASVGGPPWPWCRNISNTCPSHLPEARAVVHAVCQASTSRQSQSSHQPIIMHRLATMATFMNDSLVQASLHTEYSRVSSHWP